MCKAAHQAGIAATWRAFAINLCQACPKKPQSWCILADAAAENSCHKLAMAAYHKCYSLTQDAKVQKYCMQVRTVSFFMLHCSMRKVQADALVIYMAAVQGCLYRLHAVLLLQQCICNLHAELSLTCCSTSFSGMVRKQEDARKKEMKKENARKVRK